VAAAPASLDRNDSGVLESVHDDRMPIVPRSDLGEAGWRWRTPMRHAVPTFLVTIEGSLTAHTERSSSKALAKLRDSLVDSQFKSINEVTCPLDMFVRSQGLKFLASHLHFEGTQIAST
jgi:hypothetical protein